MNESISKEFLFPGIFRPHRGLLKDSLAEAKSVSNLEDIIKLQIDLDFPIRLEELKINYYSYDDRIKQDVWLVYTSQGVIGFLQN